MSTYPPPQLKAIATEVAALLRSRQETVCVVETACGGLISSSLLSLPGASFYYCGGLTLYTLESRIIYAGWTQEDIDRYNGPTPDIVAGLTENIRKKLKTTWVVGESGTAGPTGRSTRNRTPGYVALAVANSEDTYLREVETGSADRESNMVRFAVEALKLLRDAITDGGRALVHKGEESD